MRSQLAERTGSQEPVLLHLPPDVHSLAAAEEAIELADAYGVCDGNPLAESQKITLRAALGERVNGSWAASRVGDFGPRQGTGKNDKIAARELAGLVLYGERLIIHTAHEFQTANESFLRLVSVFENYDDLRKLVSRIRYANGEQGIEFLSGQRLKYRARTGGSGRGFAKADLIVYDEAQHLGREHVAASGPTKLASPNSQTWFAGSGGLTTSAVAWELRRAAILGLGGRLAYTEMTAEQVDVVNGKIRTTRPDPSDMDSWYRSMPGLGRWVTEEQMRAVYDELGPELFARECLCVWDPEPGKGGSCFDTDSWLECRDMAANFAGPTCAAVDVSPDSRSGALARSDGRLVVVTKHGDGTAWMVPALLEHRAEYTEVVLDAMGPAVALVAPLEAAGITVRKVTTEEAKAGCAQFLNAVNNDRTLVHVGQSELDQAITNAAQRDVGDGGWLWSRLKSSVDISPLVAATLAKWAAGVTKPVPTPGFVDLDDF